MPPALSDDEVSSLSSSGDDQIPAKSASGKADANGDEDNEASEDEDEFVVEKIVGHKMTRKGVIYDVKWQGYDDPADRTWEPRNNLEGALDILEEYHESIGGDPAAGTTKAGAKRKGRKSNAADSDAGTPAAPTKRIKQEKPWEPPTGSWETDIDRVETVEESPDPVTGERARFVYLIWNNGKKTQHPLHHVYLKCPQKMLQYYEAHLRFDDDQNGDSELRDTDMEMGDRDDQIKSEDSIH